MAQGWFVDTALRQLATMPREGIARLLALYGHLSDDEYAYVMGEHPRREKK